MKQAEVHPEVLISVHVDDITQDVQVLMSSVLWGGVCSSIFGFTSAGCPSKTAFICHFEQNITSELLNPFKSIGRDSVSSVVNGTFCLALYLNAGK